MIRRLAASADGPGARFAADQVQPHPDALRMNFGRAGAGSASRTRR